MPMDLSCLDTMRLPKLTSESHLPIFGQQSKLTFKNIWTLAYNVNKEKNHWQNRFLCKHCQQLTLQITEFTLTCLDH